jgi:hypothetical protein
MVYELCSKKKSFKQCVSCNRTEIVWARGDQLFSGRKKRARHGKITVSRKGILKIKDIDYKEAGRYTCLGRSDWYASVGRWGRYGRLA